jgi:hypothetical protein
LSKGFGRNGLVVVDNIHAGTPEDPEAITV